MCVPLGCDSDGTCEVGETCVSCADDCITGQDCGNGVCETDSGEDCLSCPEDCNGEQSGNPANRFCCGDGDGEQPVNCRDPRCNSDGFACSDDPATASCGGDFFCDGIENERNCAIDFLP